MAESASHRQTATRCHLWSMGKVRSTPVVRRQSCTCFLFLCFHDCSSSFPFLLICTVLALTCTCLARNLVQKCSPLSSGPCGWARLKCFWYQLERRGGQATTRPHGTRPPSRMSAPCPSPPVAATSVRCSPCKRVRLCAAVAKTHADGLFSLFFLVWRDMSTLSSFPPGFLPLFPLHTRLCVELAASSQAQMGCFGLSMYLHASPTLM